jgi:hypothetical protein
MITLKTINISDLPSLPLSRNAELPAVPAVYLAIDEGVVLYVGESSKLSQRWRCHEMRLHIPNWERCQIAWLEVPERRERLRIEAWLKKKYRPQLNGMEYAPPKPIDVSTLAGRDIFTPPEVAALVGDISGARVLQIAHKDLTEGTDYRMIGRVMIITNSGVQKIRGRNKKPGPKSKRNWSTAP